MSTTLMQLFSTVTHLFHPQRSNNHRPRLLHLESITSIIGVVVGFGLFIGLSGGINPNVGYILGYASNITVNDVIAQTNEERAKGGLAPLASNEKLSQAAAGKAQDMFSKQYWAHQSPDGLEPWAFISGAGYTYTAAGENLARDFMVSSDMTAAWMASPTHAANIMNARYQEIGVAVVNGSLQGIETTLVVQMFGRPSEKVIVSQLTPVAPAPKLVSLKSESVATDSVVPSETVIKPPTVLADSAVPEGSITKIGPVFSPLELVKAFSLSILLMLVLTLSYDWYLSHKRGTIRLVGKNFAHILFFSAICFVLILFKGGFVY